MAFEHVPYFRRCTGKAYRMSASDMAVTLLDLAKRVNIRAFRKSPRGPKKPRPERGGNAKQGHVSTAKLLMARHS
jgi:hypothetical protein